MKTKHSFSAFPMNPRILGISEQYRRAKHFLSRARRCKKPESKFRNAIAAVYPARAIVELMFEAVNKQELKQYVDKDPRKNHKAFETWLLSKLPYYSLIEKVRIHDFHRFGCIFPDPQLQDFFYGGPLKIKASKGGVVIQFTPQGPKVTKTGNSCIKPQRPLIAANGAFFDDDSGQYLDLCHVLDCFLVSVSHILNDFKAMVIGEKE